MMTEYYKVKNIKLFAKSIRKNVAFCFPKSYSAQIDELISVGQTENLIRQYAEISSNDEFLVSEDNYNLIFDNIKAWLYNSSLSKLASSGEIECAWDDEINEMIFWHIKSSEEFHIASCSRNNYE
jgi:hypothetical protein